MFWRTLIAFYGFLRCFGEHLVHDKNCMLIKFAASLRQTLIAFYRLLLHVRGSRHMSTPSHACSVQQPFFVTLCRMTHFLLAAILSLFSPCIYLYKVIITSLWYQYKNCSRSPSFISCTFHAVIGLKFCASCIVGQVTRNTFNI